MPKPEILGAGQFRRRARQVAVELDVPFFYAIGDESLDLTPQGVGSEFIPEPLTGTAAWFMISLLGAADHLAHGRIFGTFRLGVGNGELSLEQSFFGIPLETRQVPYTESENLCGQTSHPLRRRGGIESALDGWGRKGL